MLIFDKLGKGPFAAEKLSTAEKLNQVVMNVNSLSPLQLELLKAFAHPSVDETDLREIRKTLSQYFSRKASTEAQKFVEQRKMTANDIEAIAYQHNRN